MVSPFNTEAFRDGKGYGHSRFLPKDPAGTDDPQERFINPKSKLYDFFLFEQLRTVLQTTADDSIAKGTSIAQWVAMGFDVAHHTKAEASLAGKNS
mmetsp:Transcript_11836/g.34752  ORF Transcript_11836/g.34752 Transcript_11836/m.34752 type:complete len:96 (-) Transcript_11836:8-295(-)